MELVLPEEPTLDDDAGKSEKMKLKIQYSDWISTTKQIKKELNHVYAIYYGQCDPDMKATLAKHRDFRMLTIDKTDITILE